MTRGFMLSVLAACTLMACQPNKAPVNADPADMIIFGGPIYTALDNAPMAEAIAIDDGEIVAVGSLVDLLTEYGDGAKQLSLNGAALYPGFTDAHAHLLGLGQRELNLNLEGTSSIADLVQRLDIAAVNLPAGQALYGRGWIETGWPEQRFPNAADLDSVSPNNPVIFERADGHAVVANSAALRAAGITADTPDPDGGRIEKDAQGQPTGMLIDTAANPVFALLNAPNAAEKTRAYKAASAVYTAYGWTGLHNMSVNPADLDMIEQMSDAGDIRLRVYNSLDKSGLDALIANGPRENHNGHVLTRAIKLYVDGALGSRGAALTGPYSDKPDSRGLILLPKDEAYDLMGRAKAAGVQVNTHAIGDRGNKLVLDWYEDVLGADSAQSRWRVEHAQILHTEDIPRFADMGIIPSMQPSHAIGDLHFAPDRLGNARLKGGYAWQSLIKSGAIIAGGSDAPVERGDPMIEFYAAIARMDLSGYSAENWGADEAVSRMDALKMFTLWPAYASFQEDRLGTIQVGKRADFSVFDADIMTLPAQDIPKVKAVMTIVDGRIIYRQDN